MVTNPSRSMSKKSESTSRADSLDATMTSLKVAVRVRPLNDKEVNLGSNIVLDVLGNDIVITDLKVPEHQGYDHRSRVHNFSFDYGFSSVDPTSEQYASQATVFENFGRVVLQALLEGYNCCVIAYGQSGSGKTYTMMGMKDEEGLTPRICEGLLLKLEDKAKQNISFAVNISYMEIYNEQVYDLLQKPDERTNYNKPKLRVREHPINGPFVEGLSTHVLKSRDNVCQLISEGNDNRVKAATYVHERSSRSHAIFTVHCSQACLDESQPKEVVSKLQLVDLAGSEKAGHEFCQSRLKEGANINKSLVTLGNVIAALVELSQCLQYGPSKGGRQVFVPYRDSQLTWLIKDSLGGNSHTFMLAAVSPSKECYSETLSTLRYAQRAKNVLTVPIVNEDPATKIIRNLRSEVNKLKSLLINADVLSKEAVMKPLPNISHLISIMKKSEKKVDHLTRCWFEKWLETYNTVVKKTNYFSEESSNARKGSIDILQRQNVVSRLATERMDAMLCDSSVNFSVRTTPESSFSLKAEGSDTILSDKSSVSSECIILPNEIIFYSKGKRSHRHGNYFNECKSSFERTSLNHVTDGNNEIVISASNCVKSSSNPIFQFSCSPAVDMSLCNSVFKSLPILNYQPVSTIVHNSFFIHDPLFRFLSLPEDIQILPESIKITVETEKVDLESGECDKGFNTWSEKTCEGKKICRSDGVVSNVDHCEDRSIHRSDVEVRSNVNSNEFVEQKVRSDAHKDGMSVFDHNVPVQTHNESSCVCKESHDYQCINAFSTIDNFTNCKVNTNGEIRSCEEIQFNDCVAEESDNFVKLLNRIQDGSMETINHCFQRKDSEILSLLSLSSNDYPPFHSLDDILDYDDMEVPDETGSMDFDVLSESKGHCSRKDWVDVCSSPDVTDGSESSDAESEFDYLDFTKNTAEKYSKMGIYHDSFVSITDGGHQNLQESKFLRQANSCNKNVVLVPENERVDTDCISRAATTAGSDMKPQSRNAADIMEFSYELAPFNSTLSLRESLTGQKDCLNYSCGSDEVDSDVKISDISREGTFATHLQKNSVFQKRLCNSDSILKPLPNNKVKHCSKSDNTVYVPPEDCLILQNFSNDSEEKKNEGLYKNYVNNNNHEKTLVTNKDSVSDFLDFSVQDILDMVSDKGVVQCSTVFKKQIYSENEEEKFWYDSAILEEIQKFIDSTEITDAGKLAGELLKKRISECPTSVMCAPTSNDSVLNDHNDQNKLSFKSKMYSSCSDTGNNSDEESKQKDLETETAVSELDNAAPQPLDHEQKLVNMEKEIPNMKQSNHVINSHITEGNLTQKMNNASCTEETVVENTEYPKENENFKLFKNLHTAVQEIYCEKENALEFFTFGGCQEFLSPISNENGNLDNVGDLVSEAKKSSKLRQINDGNCSRSVVKEIVPPEYSAEHDTVPFNSCFQSFVTESENDSVNDSSSQTNDIFTDYNTFGNLNVTSLTPILEEAVDDVTSDVSEDDSPNISFQFDSLERPKNTMLTKNYKTDAIVDDTWNTGELHEPGKLSNMRSDVPKTFSSWNSDFSAKTCSETEKQDQNVGLSNSDFDCMKCVKRSNESMKPKNTLNFSSALGMEEHFISADDTLCESTNQFQFQDSEQNEQLLNSKNSDRDNVTDGETDQNDESFKNNLDLKFQHFEGANNLPNQLCSWDSASSSTSSDSITFVFVGKENKDVTLDNNSRSFQSSLFSSVSLDSLEKSSVYQNQISCISPRTLSIDSLVAEELLFQLRNSDPIQPLTSETKQTTNSKCEMNNAIPVDQKLACKKTNFAATSQLSCNQHLKMYQHRHCNMENDIFSQDVTTGIAETEKCKDQNTCHNVDRNETIPFHWRTFPSEIYSENTDGDQFQNLSENYSCINTESNGDVPVQSCCYLKTSASSKHQTDKNVHYSISDDCIKGNHTEVSAIDGVQNHIVESVFNTCANSSAAVSNNSCIDFGSHYGLDLQSPSSVVLNDGCVTASTKSSEHLVMNDYGDIRKQVHLMENVSSKENIFCDKHVNTDHHNELPSIKKLTEENLKIFNSEFEENRGEAFILTPPSTFDVSEDNGLSMISNSSSFSLDHHPSKTTAGVFSKSTQTDQTTENEGNISSENDAINDSGSKDLIMRMMDLMVETLKLMKEQYSRKPKKPVCQTRRKLHFLGDSAKYVACHKHGRYIKKERSTDSKVTNYMHHVLPVSNESDYVIGSNYPLSHSEVLPFSQKKTNENSLNMKNSVNHDDPRVGCSTAKKPNFYTLPFDFITCKYQCNKLPNTSKVRKDGAISQASVDYLADRAKNTNVVNNEFNNLSAFNSASAAECKLSDFSEMFGLKQNHPKLSDSKNHLKHLIELRRKIVESTIGSLKGNEDVSFENHVMDPLKSPSSSSEGYLSSVSSRGPLRQLSEVSTDSQESSHITDHLSSKQSFLKHNVRPLDFSSQYYRDVAASPDTRWLNTSADSGAFFLDSPGTEKKTNLDEYLNISSNGNDLMGTVSTAACTSSKMRETKRSFLHDSDNLAYSINPKKENVQLSSRIKPWNETKLGSRHHHRNKFAPGFQDLDEIGENYVDISLRKTVSVNSSTSSDLSSCAERLLRNKSSTSSKTSKNSPRLKRLSSQEIQKLLESIESDRRLLRQIQRNHVFDKKYSPSLILPSSSSFEDTDDLFYQDCYRPLPSPRMYLSPVSQG